MTSGQPALGPFLYPGLSAVEAGIGWREQLLGPHAGVSLDDCLNVHDHVQCHSLIISQLTAACLTHH